MPGFRTSLLREKFILRDPGEDLSDAAPVIALSNRMDLSLTSANGKESESFVVRAQNMHSCVRLAAAMGREFQDRGPILTRSRPFYWQDMWREVIKGYERDWNPDIWCCIYHRGRIMYQEGEHHPFLDIIEQCEARNGGAYEDSVAMAEEAFRQAGKVVRINHDANVALIVSVEKEEARCGIILRGANRTTTFNYTVRPRENDERMSVPAILSMSAAYLEGVQLAFLVGMTAKKKDFGLIDAGSDEARRGTRAADRLANLNRAIGRYDQEHNVSYRPERPVFSDMVDDAEAFAAKILAPQMQEKLRSGEMGQDEWIV